MYLRLIDQIIIIQLEILSNFNGSILHLQNSLILTRSNNLYIDGFSNNDINYIIDYIAIN